MAEDETPEPWEPKTREDYVNIFADAFKVDRDRQAQEAADREAAAKEEKGNNDSEPKRRNRNLLGGVRS